MTQKAHGIEIVNHKGQLVLDTINIEVFCLLKLGNNFISTCDFPYI